MIKKGMLIVLAVSLFSAVAAAEPNRPFVPLQQGYHTYERRQHVVEITASRGGQVTPHGRISVERGKTLAVSFRPDKGFVVRKVTVDGRSIGSTEEYVFRNVEGPHSLRVEFAPGN